MLDLEQAEDLVIDHDEADRRQAAGKQRSALVQSGDGKHSDIIRIAEKHSLVGQGDGAELTAAAKKYGLTVDQYKELTAKLCKDGQSLALFDLQLTNQKEATLNVDGVVWDGLAREIVTALEGDLKNVSNLTVKINSPGGSVSAGIRIYDALIDFKGDVTTVVTGQAASMGSIISMAGSLRRMTKASQIMAHEVSPTEKKIEGFLDTVRKANAALKNIYVERAGLSAEAVDEMFAGKDTYFSAAEAKEKGLVHEIVEGESKGDTDGDDSSATSNQHAAIWGFNDVESDLGMLVNLKSKAKPKSTAKPQNENQGVFDVTFKQWLKAQDIEISKLTKAQLESWRMIYDGEQGAAGEGEADIEGRIAGAVATDYAATLRRCQAITDKCEGFAELAAEAIENGWSDDIIDLKLENAKLKRESENNQAGGEQLTDDFGAGFNSYNIVKRDSEKAKTSIATMNAAALMSMDVDPDNILDPLRNVDKRAKAGILKTSPHLSPSHPKGIKEEHIDNALTYFNSFDLRQHQYYIARMHGLDKGLGFDQMTTPENAVSTVAFPESLMQITERRMLASDVFMNQTWRTFTRLRSVQDMKPVDMYDLSNMGRWQKATRDGTLKAGSLRAADAFTIQTDIEGQFFIISEQHLINGDFGPIGQMALAFAENGAMVPEFQCYEVLNEAAFIGGTTPFPFKGNDGGAGPASGSGNDYTAEDLMDIMWELFVRKTSRRHLEADKNVTAGKRDRVRASTPVLIHDFADAPRWDRLLDGEPQVSGGVNQQTRNEKNTLRNRFRNVTEAPYLDTDHQAIILPEPTDASSAISLAALNGRTVPRIRRYADIGINKLGVGIQGSIYTNAQASRTTRNVTVDEGLAAL